MMVGTRTGGRISEFIPAEAVLTKQSDVVRHVDHLACKQSAFVEHGMCEVESFVESQSWAQNEVDWGVCYE